MLKTHEEYVMSDVKQNVKRDRKIGVDAEIDRNRQLAWREDYPRKPKL